MSLTPMGVIPPILARVFSSIPLYQGTFDPSKEHVPWPCFKTTELVNDIRGNQLFGKLITFTHTRYQEDISKPLPRTVTYLLPNMNLGNNLSRLKRCMRL